MLGNRLPEAEIVNRMEVPGWDQLYVLGSFETRVTFYNQQVRALNLVHAMRKLPLRPNAKIAVIGAGAGGLTAAAAAAIWGSATKSGHAWEVVVFDHRPDILSLMGHGSARWLHPHIYEWPDEGTEERSAGLCIMDWQTATAGSVIDQLRPQWERIADRHGIKRFLGISDLRVERLGDGRYVLTWRGKGKMGESSYHDRDHLDSFDVVILAVGFGLERPSDDFPVVGSYWEADNLERDDPVSTGLRKRVLVSGTGDGGLIDVLRLSFRRFRHDTILQQLQEQWLSLRDLQLVRQRLPEIETTAQQQRVAGDPDYQANLNLAFADLIAKITSAAAMAGGTGSVALWALALPAGTQLRAPQSVFIQANAYALSSP
jgi:hypothetical protein